MTRITAACLAVLLAALLIPTLAQGQYCSPTELQSDVRNCGICGNDCRFGSQNSHWVCETGNCEFRGCLAGYYDLDADDSCEYACTFTSLQEVCNNLDDDCDGAIDEGVVAPSPVQVCGVSPAALTAECTSGVTRACINGNWTCTFPANVCSGGNCALTTEVCEVGAALDNNCNGLVNENVADFGGACASDDGLPAPGHGVCRTTGTRICSGPNSTQCSAFAANCASLPGGCTELCDGIDNDCDGLTDESKASPGINSANFVRPAVTQIGASLWISQYEASRPLATTASQGSGNGFFTSAPVGVTLDKTRACSEPGRLPWSNVTANEAQQVCAAMGGALCTQAEYQSACQPLGTCLWAYAPRGAAGSGCATAFTASKYCNLGPSYDFGGIGGPAGDQDGLLTSGDPFLQNCWADWAGLLSNNATTGKTFDLTGNLRELTRVTASEFRMMGGAYDQRNADGARCTAATWANDTSFRHQDSGFRCCFSTNPL